MHVSKVSISKETRKLAELHLRPGQKTKLRRQRIIDYVLSRPVGTRIKLIEFQKVAEYKSFQSADSLIKHMLKTGRLTREELGLKQYAYYVPGKQHGFVKVIRKGTVRYDMVQINELAMRFSWENPDNHNDLRKFVLWLEARARGET